MRKPRLPPRPRRLKNRATSLEEDHKRDLDQITAARGQLAAHEQTAKSSLDEVEAKRQQTEALRNGPVGVGKTGQRIQAPSGRAQ